MLEVPMTAFAPSILESRCLEILDKSSDLGGHRLMVPLRYHDVKSRYFFGM